MGVQTQEEKEELERGRGRAEVIDKTVVFVVGPIICIIPIDSTGKE